MPSLRRPRVYLAGPDVFLADAAAVGAAKVARCAAAGLVGVFPLDEAPAGVVTSDPAGGRAIFAGCRAAMDRCDAAIANLTPFRGASADVGTAVELGYLLARGVPIWGYTNDSRQYAARAAGLDDLEVESFELFDNLMCDGAVWGSSGSEVVRVEVDAAQRWHDLRGFDACVALAAARLLG